MHLNASADFVSHSFGQSHLPGHSPICISTSVQKVSIGNKNPWRKFTEETKHERVYGCRIARLSRHRHESQKKNSYAAVGNELHTLASSIIRTVKVKDVWTRRRKCFRCKVPCSFLFLLAVAVLSMTFLKAIVG